MVGNLWKFAIDNYHLGMGKILVCTSLYHPFMVILKVYRIKKELLSAFKT